MYYHAGKALVRTPLFPLKDLLPHVGDALFSFDKLIQKRLTDPVFLEALYWASPNVYQLALDLRTGEISDKKKQKQALHTLKKYIVRASSRCTPFGIFAGCSWQQIGQSNQGEKANNKELFRRRLRVDVGFLQTFIRHLEQDDQIWPFLRFRTNPTLYQMTETYRYTEQILKGEHWNAQLSTIDRTELLDEIFFHAQYASLTMNQIADLIGYEESEEEKFSFVRELLSVQFLVTDLTLELIGDRQLLCLVEQLMQIKERCKAVIPYIAFLQLLQETTETIERVPIGALNFDAFRRVKKQALQLGLKSTTSFFQADLTGRVESSAELDERMLSYLWKGAEILSRFTSSSPLEEALKRFKKLFLERYESREVPLLEVLDNEIGIGFPASSQIGHIEHNMLYEEVSSLKTTRLPMEQHKQKWHAYLQKKTEQLSLTGGLEIELTDEEVSAFEPTISQLADTVSVMCSVLPNGYLHLQNVGGSTANALLGRFAYLDAGIYEIGQTIADRERKLNDQTILAEVLFMPKGRIGNVSRRLRWYDYEIQCSENIFTSKTNGIPLTDLWVSIQGNETVLRSKRLNKRVIPRLSSAHNFGGTEQPIYQFLGAIQHQGSPGLQLNWGAWAEHKKFLPRVRYKKVILQRASWHFDEKDYLELESQENPIEALKRWLKRWQIVPYVVLGEGDNELLIHIDDDSYLQLLWVEWKKKKEIHLIEFPFLTFNPTAKPVLPHQFVIPFLRKEPRKRILSSFIQTASSVARIFFPGSDWLFIKIYCGAFNSDKILVKLVKEVGDSLKERGYINDYFFVRYTDPHYHIRFRMHIVHPETNYAEVIRCFHDRSTFFIEAKLVWKIQFDTYVRELERYGSKQIEQNESLFAQDTQMILQLLQEESVQDDDLLRLRLGIMNLDNWLDLFNLQLADKLTFIEEMITAFTEEFGRAVKTKLERQYRELLSQYEMMPGSEYNRFFAYRRAKLKNIAAIDNLASYIHMSMNRLFKANQRVMEFACYIFLGKEYRRTLGSNGKRSL